MEEIAELKHENFRVIDALGIDRATWWHSSRYVGGSSLMNT